jgi:predicted HicB family RNase H-like nuclease
MGKNKKLTMTFRPSDELSEKIRDRAYRENKTLNDFIESCIKQYLEEN